MSATNSYEKSILGNLLRGSSIASTTPYMGLSQADPGETAVALTEPSGNGYSRVNLMDSEGSLPLGAAGTEAFLASTINNATGTVQNDNQIVFPEATDSWGTITHWFIANHPTNPGAAILAKGALTTPRLVEAGERLTFPAGSLSLTAN